MMVGNQWRKALSFAAVTTVVVVAVASTAADMGTVVALSRFRFAGGVRVPWEPSQLASVLRTGIHL